MLKRIDLRLPKRRPAEQRAARQLAYLARLDASLVLLTLSMGDAAGNNRRGGEDAVLSPHAKTTLQL